MISYSHEFWMQRALQLAKKANLEGEIPVGAVLVYNNKIIGEGWNRSIADHDPTAHAEIIALREAGNFLKNYRLLNSNLYITLEPCIMCTGAILHSRVKNVIFSANNKKIGLNKIFQNLNIKKSYRLNIIKGVLCCISIKLLKNFFKLKR